MATQDNTANKTGGNYYVFAASNSFTFSGEGAGEVVQMVSAKKGWEILEVVVSSTALGAGVTVQVGDGNDPNRFVTSTVATSAVTARTNANTGMGYVYTADDTIDVTTGVGAATGTVDLTVIYSIPTA